MDPARSKRKEGKSRRRKEKGKIRKLGSDRVRRSEGKRTSAKNGEDKRWAGSNKEFKKEVQGLPDRIRHLRLRFG